MRIYDLEVFKNSWVIITLEGIITRRLLLIVRGDVVPLFKPFADSDTLLAFRGLKNNCKRQYGRQPEKQFWEFNNEQICSFERGGATAFLTLKIVAKIWHKLAERRVAK
jgi:hypothetical protein